jgi:hypothetical protein
MTYLNFGNPIFYLSIDDDDDDRLCDRDVSTIKQQLRKVIISLDESCVVVIVRRTSDLQACERSSTTSC